MGVKGEVLSRKRYFKVKGEGLEEELDLVWDSESD